jgi:hypothetical protein
MSVSEICHGARHASTVGRRRHSSCGSRGFRIHHKTGKSLPPFRRELSKPPASEGSVRHGGSKPTPREETRAVLRCRSDRTTRQASAGCWSRRSRRSMFGHHHPVQQPLEVMAERDSTCRFHRGVRRCRARVIGVTWVVSSRSRRRRWFSRVSRWMLATASSRCVVSSSMSRRSLVL